MAVRTVRLIARLPKLYRAEKGTRGSIHYAGATFSARAEAEACADRLAGAWAAHPAATASPLSYVEELPLTSAEARTVAACREHGEITLGAHVRVKPEELHRLENCGLVRVREEEEYDDCFPRRWEVRYSYRVALTAAGRAWLAGEGGAR